MLAESSSAHELAQAWELRQESFHDARGTSEGQNVLANSMSKKFRNR